MESCVSTPPLHGGVGNPFDLASAFDGSLRELTAARAARRRARRVARFQQEHELALRAVAVMQAVAAFKINITVNYDVDEDASQEANLNSLKTLRMLHVQIAGKGGDALREAIKEAAPREVVRYDRERELAVANLAELRAFVAVTVGEHDDEELGIEVLPPVDWDDCDPASTSVPWPA